MFPTSLIEQLGQALTLSEEDLHRLRDPSVALLLDFALSPQPSPRRAGPTDSIIGLLAQSSTSLFGRKCNGNRHIME